MPDLLETPSSPAEPESPHRGGGTIAHGPFVRVMTVVIVALVFAMSALIFKRWLDTPERDCAVVIAGDATLDSSKVAVSGYGQTIVATLNAENNFVTPVLLEPGHYQVLVTHHGRKLLERDFIVERLHMMRYDLPALVEVVAPVASAHDVEVTFENEKGETARLTVTPADRFRGKIYLYPAFYHVIAREEGRVVAREELNVDHAHAAVLRLGAPPQD